MKVLFYQPNHTGHHFAYLARMLPGFAGLPIERVLATTPEAANSPEYARTLAPFANELTFVTSCSPAPKSPVANARHRLRELRQAICRVKPDHVAVCYADGLWDRAFLSTMLGRRPWSSGLVVEGWLYRGRFGDRSDRRWKSRIRRRMFAGLLRKGLFRKLHLDHELLYDFALPLSAGTPTEVMLTPNPVKLGPQMSKEEARRALRLDVAGPWISLSGMVAKFKGADLLIDAFHQLRSRESNAQLRLLLAGPHEEQIRALLAQVPYRQWVEKGSIVSLDRYIDEDEMYLAAAAADLVVAPYPNHQGRSSIILWAAAAGRPCLGTRASCVGHVIREQQLGGTCEVENPDALAKAIHKMLDAPWTSADSRRVRKYAEFHRIENYQRTASELVRARLNPQTTAGDAHGN